MEKESKCGNPDQRLRFSFKLALVLPFGKAQMSGEQ